MGQELHLHNHIVNGKDNTNGKQQNIKYLTAAITAQTYSRGFEMKGGGGLKGRRKSILNISFQSNVNNLCCLSFLSLLFIY